MNILIFAGKPPLPHDSIPLGWLHAFSSLGYRCKLWIKEKENSFDVFDTFQPDVVFAYTKDIERDFVKCLKQYPNTKPVLFLSDWEDAEDKEIYLFHKIMSLKDIKKIAFSHNLNSFLHQTHRNWSSSGVRVLSCLPAGDITVYKPESLSSERNDITYIGYYTNSKNIRNFILPLTEIYNIKIYGYGNWPTPYHLGFIDNNKLLSSIINNSIINLAIPRLDSKTITEKVFKILACGGFCLSYETEPINLFEGTVPSFAYYSELEKLIEKFLKQPDLCYDLSYYSHKILKAKHTYYNRIQQIFKELELPTDKFDRKIEELE